MIWSESTALSMQPLGVWTCPSTEAVECPYVYPCGGTDVSPGAMNHAAEHTKTPILDSVDYYYHFALHHASKCQD